MQDFFCHDPAQMHYPELAERADFFKHKKEGVSTMCKIMQTLQEEGRAEGQLEMATNSKIIQLSHIRKEPDQHHRSGSNFICSSAEFKYYSILFFYIKFLKIFPKTMS